MTSICNYSHPELQITEGLTRQTSGILFPYNPEFYKLASELYGPGTIYCWTIKATDDLLAALAHPTFAATDALIHSLRILKIEYRALAIFCLRNPGVELDKDFGTFNHTQLDLCLPILPEIVTLGQHAIDLGGPLPVCYTFMFMVFVPGLSYFAGMMDQFCWEPTTWGKRLVSATYGYVFLALTIFHFSLGDIGISMVLCMYEALLPVVLAFLFLFCAWASLSTLGWIVALIDSYRERDYDGRKGLGGSESAAVMAGFMIFGVKVNGIPLTPDVAVSISDRDQIAALIGGIVTLCFTVTHIIRAQIKIEEEGEGEEMERLTGDV